MKKRGPFITFEGIEGSGKSSHIKLLSEFLSEMAYDVVTTFEPGASSIGGIIRSLLLEGNLVDPWVEALLFLTERRQHIKEVLLPSLGAGKIVLCDRFIDSTIAYQGYGRGLPIALLKEINGKIAEDLHPDLTILLDCTPEEGLRRTKGTDRFQKESLEFHQRVREGYLQLAKEEPQRIKVVPSDRDKSLVQAEIRQIVLDFLSRWQWRPL